MVPGSTFMYGSSLTIATLRPRASRIAPSEAEAMPLPNEDTTPPVTNTKRVICKSGSSRRTRSRPQIGATTTGQQVSTSARTNVGRVRRLSRAPDQAGAPPARSARLHRLIEPEASDRDQRLSRENQRQSRALRHRHARFLQQALERATPTAAQRTQALTAPACADGERGGECLQIQRSARIALQREPSERRGQRAGPAPAPRPADLLEARRRSRRLRRGAPRAPAPGQCAGRCAGCAPGGGAQRQ